jgi:hypothetical protein
LLPSVRFHGVKAGRKPGSVHRPGGPGRWVIICLGSPSPATSSGSSMAGRGNGQPLPLGLAPSRGLPSRHLSMPLVRSYRTLAPLPDPAGDPSGHRRCVSVALSSRSPALGVTQQAWPLGSPDFPQARDTAEPMPGPAITSPAFKVSLPGSLAAVHSPSFC